MQVQDICIGYVVKSLNTSNPAPKLKIKLRNTCKAKLSVIITK